MDEELKQIRDTVTAELLSSITSLTGTAIDATSVNGLLVESIATQMAVATSTGDDALLEITKSQADSLGKIVRLKVEGESQNVLGGVARILISGLSLGLAAAARAGVSKLTEEVTEWGGTPETSGSRRRGKVRKEGL